MHLGTKQQEPVTIIHSPPLLFPVGLYPQIELFFSAYSPLSLSLSLKYFRNINWETCFILEMSIFLRMRADLTAVLN